MKPADAQRFFGFLEGRTGLTIPDWWQGDGDFPGNAESITEEEIEPMEPLPAGKWQFKLCDGESAETVAGGVRFADGEHSAVVKEDILESLRKGYDLDNCKVSSGHEKISIYFYDELGSPGPLLLVDATTGKLEWQTEVWGLGTYIGGTSGAWPVRVDLDNSDSKAGRVVVWGKANFGAYLEAFDFKTGKSLFRFSTNYWHAWDGE